MKLSGSYSLDDLRRALQGNFSCTEFVKDSHGHTLPEEKQYIRIELFFIALEFYPKTGEVIVSKIKDDGKGSTELRKIMKISGSQPENN